MAQGTVYLGGGGSAEQERALWSTMLQRRPRVLYWPFALPAAMLPGAETWLRRSLDSHSPALPLTTWTSLAGHASEELATHDLLFVGGGNTFELMHQVRRHGFAGAVRSFVGNGGHYYGGSAGAILAGDSIEIAGWYDANDTDLTDLAGLGLVPGVDLLPHYARDAELRARRWSGARGVPVLGIPESSGLVVHGSSIRVAGPESVWCLTADQVIEHAPGARLSLLDLKA